MPAYVPSSSFHDAASYLSKATGLSKLSSAAKLELYGVFKFLTVSPRPQSVRPSIFSLEGRAKWDAWSSAALAWSGKEEEAESRYKEIAQNLGWVPGTQPATQREHTAEELLAAEDTDVRGEAGAGMGTAVSSVSRPSASDEDAGTVHGFAIADDVPGLLSFLRQHADTDLNQVDQYGYTPLHMACDRGNGGVVEVLISRGADPSIKDEDGFSALELAQEAGHTSIITLLERH